MRPLLTLALLFVSTCCLASEAEHCRRLAPKYDAQLEVRMWDGTRADLVNDEYAFEVDYAPKWAEGVGQALYYAQLTGKKPALILLTQRNQARFAYRAQTAAARSGVAVFIEWVKDPDPAVDINIGPLNIHIPAKSAEPVGAALRAYMIQNDDGRWLRRTIPGQINIWVVDQGSASIWVNKQEAHRVWASLGPIREVAELQPFLLVPVEDKE